MAKQLYVAGTTSRTEYVRILDMNGSAITGLVFNSSGLLSKYVLPLAASVSITLATQTVTGAWSSGGFVEVDSIAFPGLYRFDIVNAAFASGDKVIVSLYGFAGMNVSMLEYELTAVNLQDGVRFGLTSLPNAVAGANNGLPLGNASGQVTLASSQLFIKKNTALNNFEFLMVQSTNHITPATGLTVTAQRSIDGAAFGSCSNAVSELSNGIYILNISASDVNGTVITFMFSATGADIRYLTVVTQT
jgi:hypothetical protein